MKKKRCVFVEYYACGKEDLNDAALRAEIRDRVYYLRYPSRLLNMLSRKNLSSFGDGTFRLH